MIDLSTLPPFPTGIDSSCRSDFVACPTKWLYSTIHRLRQPVSSPDLAFGGAFALGVEHTRKLFYFQHEHATMAIVKGTNLALEYWIDQGFWESDHPQKNTRNLIRCMLAYFQQYPLGLDPYQPANSNAFEFTFAIPLPILNPSTGENILFIGRLDMLAKVDSAIWILDEKTKSQIASNWQSHWTLRGQFLGYIYACQYYGIDPTGVIVRGIAPYAGEVRTVEAVLLKQQWLVDRWYQQLLVDVQRMVDCYTSGRYPQAFDDSCTSYSGCPFQMLCTSQEPAAWAEGNYIESTWNPLNPSTL